MQFTPTEERILKVLADGDRHTYEEMLKECMEDELATRSNLRQHVYNLRAKLRLIQHEILCEVYYKRKYYRHVLRIAPAKNEEPDHDTSFNGQFAVL